MGNVRFDPSGAVSFSGDFGLEELEKITKQVREAKEALKDLAELFQRPPRQPQMEAGAANGQGPKHLHHHHRPLSQAGMILSYLTEHKDKTVNIDRLQAVLKGAAPTSIRTVLSILTRNGEIKRAGHGRYTAAISA